MRIYECPTHDQDFQSEGCDTCANILKRIEDNRKAPRTRFARLRQSVYWPTRMGHEGRLIENLGHRPTFVKNKDVFRDELKKRGLAEAG